VLGFDGFFEVELRGEGFLGLKWPSKVNGVISLHFGVDL